MYKLIENAKVKMIRSEDYNYNFDKKTGYFARWGKTLDDDPQFSPIGPEILDLELSVNGCPNNCKFCYKGNTNDKATNMSFETYKTILSKMPRVLTQVALGITGVQTNTDFIKILKYTREQEIIPNFTLSGIDLTDELANEIVKYIGAVAVSAYETNKNICYNTVKKFTDLGIKQTNIHLMCSKENENFVYEVLNDIQNDDRLKNLNAVVLLKLKPKGRAIQNNFSNMSVDDYEKLVEYCISNRIRFGFDSCTAPDYEYAIDKSKLLTDENKKEYIQMSESCESFGLFSSYIDVFGNYFPCSFAAGEGEWQEGISVLNCDNFIKDVWFSNKLNAYRKLSLSSCYKSGCRKCLIFPEINPKEDFILK